jgi:hypothetical protein
LYRDFEAPDIDDTAMLVRIREAVREAGWVLAEPKAPNVVSAENRTIGRWGLYRIDVALDVLPVGSGYVRVIFHPYRRFFTGGRSKIQYLSAGMRRKLLPDLVDALDKQGLAMLGTPIERDREQTRTR